MCPMKEYTPVLQTQQKPNQNTEEQKWGQHICKMERDISVRPAGPVKGDQLNTLTRPN